MAKSGWNDPWQRFAESKPIKVDGGIATSKQRGAMASTWWSKRFVDMLDSYGLGGRMQRGRRYARTGQVMSLEVSPGLLIAQVQGSRPKPYLVSIRSTVVGEPSWEAVQHAIGRKIGFVARLLNGEVPEELDSVCAEAGIELFPSRWSDITASCNCPDWESPCKHLAAVLYVFADQLDTDPWLLFTWRGRTREQMLSAVSALSTKIAPDDGLPVWWPLRPGHNDLERARWRAPMSVPADSPYAVLARLGALDVEVDGFDVTMLAPIYELLAVDAGDSAGSGEPIEPAD
ncbi:MAG: SWIM zinc finger family protein [Acidimicrobiia bacterium]